MAKGQHGSNFQQLHALFTSGTIGPLTDAQLIARFEVGDKDAAERAFAALVERHGPMVLRICRDILRDDHEADDAFQAAFLILALKAPSLRLKDSLAPWLHAVACRTALCARSAATRRKKHERRAAEAAKRSYVAGNADDSGRILHEEVSRLPERFRQPIVLCYLQGLTSEQSARLLGWPVGTVRSRLARGRERLRGRLSRRGLAPSAGLAAVLATEAVPAAIVEVTTQAAMRIATGQALFGVVPRAIMFLVRRVNIEMTAKALRNVGITALVPLIIVAAYFGWRPSLKAGDAPVPPTAASGGVARESIERLLPLLGTWELGQFRENKVTIKLLRADPGLARDLGFEAPFVCTWTSLAPGKDNLKPSQLLFVDPSREPAQITFQILGYVPSDSNHVDGIPGIYRVEGDTLTILTPTRVGSPRPSSFRSPDDTTSRADVYHRVVERSPMKAQ